MSPDEIVAKAVEVYMAAPEDSAFNAMTDFFRTEIERLRKALAEIADPDLALLASTKANIAREALQDQQVGNK